MNTILSQSGAGSPARLRYLDGEIEMLAPGDYVLCAVTGAKIDLDDLRYWSVDRQEAYADAAAANAAYAEARKNGAPF